MKLTVIVEQGTRNWGAYTPDDIGSVIATGRTRDDTLDNFRGALRSHLTYLRQQGQPVPDVTELDVQELVPLGVMAA